MVRTIELCPKILKDEKRGSKERTMHKWVTVNRRIRVDMSTVRMHKLYTRTNNV